MVVRGFFRMRKTAEAFELADLIEFCAAPCQELVRIGLMADIENELILRGAEDFMQRNGQLYAAEIGSEVPAVDGEDIDDLLADLLCELLQFGNAVFLNVSGRGDLIEYLHSHPLGQGTGCGISRCEFLCERASLFIEDE